MPLVSFPLSQQPTLLFRTRHESDSPLCSKRQTVRRPLLPQSNLTFTLSNGSDTATPRSEQWGPTLLRPKGQTTAYSTCPLNSVSEEFQEERCSEYGRTLVGAEDYKVYSVFAQVTSHPRPFTWGPGQFINMVPQLTPRSHIPLCWYSLRVARLPSANLPLASLESPAQNIVYAPLCSLLILFL